jgi:hypothetical protein
MTLSVGVPLPGRALPTGAVGLSAARRKQAPPGAACQAAHAQQTKLVPPPRLERGTSRSTI